MVNLLAGDVGGTTTRLGLFERTSSRPRPVAMRSFATLDFPNLPAIISAFLEINGANAPIESACFGVAGPVADGVADLTNVPWSVEAADVERVFKIPRVKLLNDLEALAYAVPVLRESEVHVLQAGRADDDGNIAIIAAGTGLGEALLQKVDGRYVALASEAGHADFAARTDRDIMLLRHLVRRYGRAQVEDVLSGRGLVDIHMVCHAGPCEAGVDLGALAAPADISAAALDGRCGVCVKTLELFVEAYGAEAGNLALRTMATGGVFVGGGIAPKILAALTTGAFMSAFRAKAPFEAMLGAVPVKVILNSDAGVLGAANYCSQILRTDGWGVS
jgi:glucokinase